jgi:hypothetical protein
LLPGCPTGCPGDAWPNSCRDDFLPGHDQRAIHERIAKVGTVKDFITWFDDSWTEPASLEPAR